MKEKERKSIKNASEGCFDRMNKERKICMKEVTEKGDPKEEILVNRLKQRGWHIAFAESCTGGLCAARLINVPSASYVINESIVTYANAAKVKYLNVPEELIEKYGVVSEPVASAMAAGMARAAKAEISAATSGIAGPSGGSEEKPVGMVCFGFYISGELFTETRQFGDIGRNEVRKASVDFVFDTLLKLTE